MSKEPLQTIKFEPRKNSDHPPLVVEAKRGYDPNVCEHNERWINREARTVTCKKCGVQLDPFDVLYRLSCYGMELDSRVAEIRRHAELEREKAERRAQQKKDAVPMMLGTLKTGDKVRVEFRNAETSGCMGGFVSDVDGEYLYLEYGDHYSDKVPVEEITLVRVLKRAKP
jgi:hypothetical protein